MQPTRSSSRAPDALDVAVNQVGIGSGIDTGGTGSGPPPPAPRPVWSEPRVHAYAEVLVAVLPTREAAEAALERLRVAGVSAEQCGLVVRTGTLTHARGLLARAGCADTGPFEALRQLGVPDQTACRYQQTFEAGQAVVAVRPTEATERALSTLQQVVGMDTRQGLIDARPVERRPADRPAARGRPGRRRSRAATARATR
jgi:hypothetical protein